MRTTRRVLSQSLLNHINNIGLYRTSLFHVKSLIDSNTVAIVGSACQFASGTVDPIEALAKVAIAAGVGLHVDCCLGGFLVPFMDKVR